MKINASTVFNNYFGVLPSELGVTVHNEKKVSPREVLQGMARAPGINEGAQKHLRLQAELSMDAADNGIEIISSTRSENYYNVVLKLADGSQKSYQVMPQSQRIGNQGDASMSLKEIPELNVDLFLKNVAEKANSTQAA